jgi:hypothetical protein
MDVGNTVIGCRYDSLFLSYRLRLTPPCQRWSWSCKQINILASAELSQVDLSPLSCPFLTFHINSWTLYFTLRQLWILHFRAPWLKNVHPPGHGREEISFSGKGEGCGPADNSTLVFCIICLFFLLSYIIARLCATLSRSFTGLLSHFRLHIFVFLYLSWLL